MLLPGYWAPRYWPDRYWDQDYWPHWTAVPPVPPVPGPAIDSAPFGRWQPMRMPWIYRDDDDEVLIELG